MNQADAFSAAGEHAPRFTDSEADRLRLRADEYFAALSYLSNQVDTYSTGPTPENGSGPQLSAETTELLRGATTALDQALRSRAQTVLEEGGDAE